MYYNSSPMCYCIHHRHALIVWKVGRYKAQCPMALLGNPFLMLMEPNTTVAVSKFNLSV